MRSDDITGAPDMGTRTSLPVHIYSGWARPAIAMLLAVSGASLLVALAILLWSDGPVNPLWLLRFTAAWCLAPWVAAHLLRRAARGVARIDDRTLVLETRHRRVDIPVGSVVAVDPWLVPLPGSGLALRLRSGRRWGDGVEIADPLPLLEALTAAGGSPAVAAASRHPAVTYAHAAAARRPLTWVRGLLRFPAFALVPTLPLFRVHQIIAYGGTLGEYRLHGLGPYLAGFGLYWATLTVYLMVYAAALRTMVEPVATAAVLVVPRHAMAVRRVLERVSATLYFAGVPLAVGLRLLPW